MVGGGLGPLPTEAQLLDEFVPEERLVNRCEAVIRVFNKYGNRKNKNKARLKFVVRERGFDWVREQIEKEYQDILANGGIPTARSWFRKVLVVFNQYHHRSGTATLLAGRTTNGHSNPRVRALARDQRPRTEAARLRHRHGEGPAGKPDRGADARSGRHCAERGRWPDARGRGPESRSGIYPVAAIARIYAALRQAGLGEAGAHEIDDVTTCPGAYSCNLALTKSMNLGAALAEEVRDIRDPLVRQLTDQDQRLPQLLRPALDRRFRAFTATPARSTARKFRIIRCCWAEATTRGHDAVRRGHSEHPGAPGAHGRAAGSRSLRRNRQAGESFREYVLRHKVETFRLMTNDLGQAGRDRSRRCIGTGATRRVLAQLGRGECAASFLGNDASRKRFALRLCKLRAGDADLNSQCCYARFEDRALCVLAASTKAPLRERRPASRSTGRPDRPWRVTASPSASLTNVKDFPSALEIDLNPIPAPHLVGGDQVGHGLHQQALDSALQMPGASTSCRYLPAAGTPWLRRSP